MGLGRVNTIRSDFFLLLMGGGGYHPAQSHICCRIRITYMPNLMDQAFLAVQRKAMCFFSSSYSRKSVIFFFPTLHNLRNSWIYLLSNFAIKTTFQMRIRMKNLKRIFRQQTEEMLGFPTLTNATLDRSCFPKIR